MNTLQRNITLLAVFCVLGISLVALRATRYNVEGYKTGTTLGLNIKVGDTFTLELDENPTTGPNYLAWSTLNMSNNLAGGEKTFKGPDSKKVGASGHAVFTFTAEESGPASVTFGQRAATRTHDGFDNQKTFNFTIK